MIGRIPTWMVTSAILLLIVSLSAQQQSRALVVYANSPAFRNGQSANLVLGQPDFVSNNPTTTQHGMYYPSGVAVDPVSGNIFVADEANNRVLRFTSIDALSTHADAEGVLGQPNFTSNAPATTRAGMRSPRGIAIDSSGTLWVADVANHRVLRFAQASSLANGADASGVLGQVNFTSNADPGATASTMSLPTGVAVDNDERLWVADSGYNRVLRFDQAATKPNGADADGVLGQPDFIYQVASSTANTFNNPSDVAVDSSGHVWVADAFNSRVLRFDQAATKPNGADADGVLGQLDFDSDAFATTQQSMDGPRGVDIDGNGRLWVADTGNRRVLWFDQASSKANGAHADGVLGQLNFTNALAATTQSGMDAPIHVAVDMNGQVWVADTTNHRTLYFSSQSVATDTPTHTLTHTATPTSTTTPTQTITPTRLPYAFLPRIVKLARPSQ